ncbi:uncharacterized protein BX663DRAFT_523390 [Cokeromyces recurvatus]|uniref:uncharacterized protein n=1 Tax=Cokeromyces recurvatus TaxID=90255 RepID=UPI002220A460|nr:uncharacterized protein BX663DRAFT_523390 [Cokeromyces recurvatus]KAI7898770.1 hypothetical protein BX663DRAFT_523390 [Cokeromyces recurvatus]
MGLFSNSKTPQLQQATSYQGAPPPYSPSASTSYTPPPPLPPKQPMNPDTRMLPNGWISQYDPASGKFFYVYTPTALRQWEHPADKPLNSGENSSYNPQQQQPYYNNFEQQQQQQQRYYPQQQQPYYSQQQPQYVVQQPTHHSRFGGSQGMGFGKMAAAGLGGGLLGYMIGDAIFDNHHPDIIENNYYGDDFGGGGFDGGFYDGGFGF